MSKHIRNEKDTELNIYKVLSNDLDFSRKNKMTDAHEVLLTVLTRIKTHKASIKRNLTNEEIILVLKEYALEISSLLLSSKETDIPSLVHNIVLLKKYTDMRGI